MPDGFRLFWRLDVEQPNTLAFMKLLFPGYSVTNHKQALFNLKILHLFSTFFFTNIYPFIKFLHLSWPLVSFYLLLSYSFNELNMHYNENLVSVFPEKELRGPSSNFHIHVSLSIFSCNRISRPVVGIYKSLTDTWMWKLGLRPRNIPFLEIFVLDFRYFAFAVWLTNSYMYWNLQRAAWGPACTSTMAS